MQGAWGDATSASAGDDGATYESKGRIEPTPRGTAHPADGRRPREQQPRAKPRTEGETQPTTNPATMISAHHLRVRVLGEELMAFMLPKSSRSFLSQRLARVATDRGNPPREAQITLHGAQKAVQAVRISVHYDRGSAPQWFLVMGLNKDDEVVLGRDFMERVGILPRRAGAIGSESAADHPPQGDPPETERPGRRHHEGHGEPGDQGPHWPSCTAPAQHQVRPRGQREVSASSPPTDTVRAASTGPHSHHNTTPSPELCYEHLAPEALAIFPKELQMIDSEKFRKARYPTDLQKESTERKQREVKAASTAAVVGAKLKRLCQSCGALPEGVHTAMCIMGGTVRSNSVPAQRDKAHLTENGNGESPPARGATAATLQEGERRRDDSQRVAPRQVYTAQVSRVCDDKHNSLLPHFMRNHITQGVPTPEGVTQTAHGDMGNKHPKLEVLHGEYKQSDAQTIQHGELTQTIQTDWSAQRDRQTEQRWRYGTAALPRSGPVRWREEKAGRWQRYPPQGYQPNQGVVTNQLQLPDPQEPGAQPRRADQHNGLRKASSDHQTPERGEGDTVPQYRHLHLAPEWFNQPHAKAIAPTGYHHVLTSTQVVHQGPAAPAHGLISPSANGQGVQLPNQPRRSTHAGELEQLLSAHPANGIYEKASSRQMGVQYAPQYPRPVLQGASTSSWQAPPFDRPLPKRPHNLPVFSGEEGTIKPNEWFKRWCDTVEAEGVTVELALRVWLKSSLQGKALLWHNFNVSEGVQKVTRETFKADLMLAFDPFYMRTLQSNWASCSQHQQEPITDFIARAAAYIKELCPNEDDPTKVKMVISKVIFTYKWPLSRAGCQNLVQLMEYASRLQFELMEAHNSMQKPQPVVWAEPSLAPAGASTAWAAAGERRSRSESQPHTRLSQTKSPARLRCTGCGQFGHGEENCRRSKQLEGGEAQPKEPSMVPKN